MSQARVTAWGTEDFLRWEARQEYRFELVHGEPRMMTGGTRAHNIVSGNIFAVLRQALRGSRCVAHIADMKVLCPNGSIRYPDVAVDCGSHGPSDTALTEPTVIIEVISPSTRWVDQNEKLDEYRAIPSLRHYVLVRQDTTRVEHWARPDRTWQHEMLDRPDAALFPSAIGVSIVLRDIYEGLDLYGG